MPREQLRELQLERMKKSIRHAYDNVDFYKKSFAEADVTPDDLTCLEDLAKFPFVVKQDMRDAYPFGLFAVPKKDVARIHASSGTTGQATVVGHTANDIKNWGDCFARGIYMVGGTADSTVQVSYGYGLFTGGLGAHYGAEAAGCSVIPTSSGNTKRQIQMMVDLGTDILCCTPSYALYLADTAISMGYDPAKDFKLSAGIFGAEPASENMRQEIRDKLGIRYCDVYGLSEVMGPGVAMECSESHGLHLAEDHFFAEIIDPETCEPLPYGTQGELVFTSLTKKGFPMLRYRTRDICILGREACPCGRTHIKMCKPMGRSDDMLIVKGVNVFPSQIETVLLEQGYTSNYQIVVDRVNNSDTLDVLVEMTPDHFSDSLAEITKREKGLVAALKAMLGIYAQVHLVSPKSIARSEGKAIRVIDKRKI